MCVSAPFTFDLVSVARINSVSYIFRENDMCMYLYVVLCNEYFNTSTILSPAFVCLIDSCVVCLVVVCLFAISHSFTIKKNREVGFTFCLKNYLKSSPHPTPISSDWCCHQNPPLRYERKRKRKKKNKRKKGEKKRGLNKSPITNGVR